MSPRVLVFLLDGGTWTVAAPLIRSGALPNLAALRGEGVWGPLASTVPPVTPPAFGAIATGLNPGRHGLLDFRGHDPQNFLLRPPTSAQNLKAETIWRRLAAAGRRVGLLHVPFTWPCDPSAAFVVPGQPAGERNRTWPITLAGELEGIVPGWQRAARNRLGGRRLIEAMENAEERRRRVTLYLAAERAWDVLVVVIKASDAVAHAAWAAHDPTHPEHVRCAVDGDPLARVYRHADALLGELRQLAPDASILLGSDHGHGPCLGTFGINQWLQEAGYLRLRPEFKNLGRVRYGLERARHGSGWDLFVSLVDWDRTRAYGGTGTEQGIYLNRRGREPAGTVTDGVESERVLRSLRDDLAALSDSGEAGGELHVQDGPATRPGPCSNQGPDLHLEVDGGRRLLREGLRPGALLRGPEGNTGTHQPNGLWLAAGPPVRERGPREGAWVGDLAPTILQLAGVPIPSGLDGRPLLAMGAAKDPRPLEVSTSPPENGPDSPYDQEDRLRIQEELRALGYLDE